MNRLLLAVCLSLASHLAAVEPRAKAQARREPAGTARLYQTGVDSYARGDLPAALAAFREVTRREPGHRSALAAVRRLESELGAPPARDPSPPPAAASGRLERFLLRSVPRWFRFERTFGDPLSDVGTLTALNARVVQLMGERRMALARNRSFAKDRELRALLRRAPLASRVIDEV
ncbi:MAG: hypothetical protein HYV14_04985 [Elusimicrobia bacterium]|nr:hypothetical protein [Elusimicrobiota bacterium]